MVLRVLSASLRDWTCVRLIGVGDIARPGQGDDRGRNRIRVPTVMRTVYRQLERWRRKRTGRERIPESLWVAAGELAREHREPGIAGAASGVQSSEAYAAVHRR